MQDGKSNIDGRILLCLFIISLSLFTFQVTMTRLYSAILSYHYVFLTTSLAILGVGIGSVLAYWDKRRLKNIIGTGSGSVMRHFNRGSFVLSCGFIVVFLLIYVQPFVDSLMIYTILGFIPFVISGYLYALLFKAWSVFSGKLYFADLIGAGTGSIVIILLLDHMGMFKTVLLVCTLPLLSAFLLPVVNKKLKIAEYAVSLFLIAGLFLPGQTVGAIETNFYALLNNTGKTYGEMARSGLGPEIIFSRWDSFARTDLIELEDVPEVKFLTIDGAANAPMYAFDGDASNLDHFKRNNGYLPFTIGRTNSSLIIGAGGGRGVLYALAAAGTDIAVVEINAASVEAAQLFGDFNGSIFNRPEVSVYIQDGRNFVRTTDERFDIIFLSLVVTNTTQGVGFALSENYIHTVEAMEDYLSRLSENGRIAFVAHDRSALARLTTTAIQALLNRGVPLEQTPDHMAYFYRVAEVDRVVQAVAPTIIIKDVPFTEAESTRLALEITNIDSIAEHIPYIHEQESLTLVKAGRLSFEQFIDGFDMRAAPVTDDNPFFFHFERGIPATLLQILIIGFIGTLLLFVPFARKKGNLKPSIYFGLLGMGFMMIQIPLIQRFILYLGHPTPAFSYILAAMLAGCGIGGYLNKSRAFHKASGRVYLPPILAATVCLVLLLLLNLIFEATAGMHVVGKIMVSSLIAAGAGFFLGMPFPRGLALLGESDRGDAIPVMWGVNGTMSVIGSVLSIILSMTFGFTIASIAGASIYVAVGFFKEL